MSKLNKSWVFIFLLLLSLGCERKSEKPNFEIVDDMMTQPAVKSQGSVPSDPSKSGMMVPPEGSVPRGFKPYPYTTPAQAEQGLSNPIAGDFSPNTIDTGRIYYERYCLVCHGATGDGKGPVHEKFNGLIKSLLTSNARELSDARIFHIITTGQGVMGSYQEQIQDEDIRWAVVNYVRSLQRQAR